MGKKAAILRQRLFAFAIVVGLGLLIILATVVNMAFAWFGSIIKDYFGGSYLLSVLNVLALLGVIVLANAFIYKVLPDVKLAWRDVWLGSFAATLLMALGGLVIGLYFNWVDPFSLRGGWRVCCLDDRDLLLCPNILVRRNHYQGLCSKIWLEARGRF